MDKPTDEQRRYMKVVTGFLCFLTTALVVLWILTVLEVCHWSVAVVGTVGIAGCILTVHTGNVSRRMIERSINKTWR